MSPPPMPAANSHSSEPKLSPVLDPRFALGLPHVLGAALFGGLFLLFSYLPLRGTDLWGHIAYGHWILDHGTLPREDPFLPLAEGMRVVDSAWLAQVSLAAVESAAGGEGLSAAFALISLATYLVLARAFYVLTGRLGLALVGTLAVLGVGVSRLTTIRPETFGALLFALLLWMLSQRVPLDSEMPADLAHGRPRSDRWLWAWWPALGLLFAVWANVHGSFVCGLAVLGASAIGRAVDLGWKDRSVRAVLSDPGVRQLIWSFELAAAATLINPYGFGLWVETARFAGNPNLRDVVEWFPMQFLGVGGREFLASLVAAAVLLRHSRVRVSAASILLLLLFGIAAAARVRMIGWYAPLYGWVLVPHLADVALRLCPRRAPRTAPIPIDAPADVSMDSEDYPPLPPGRSWKYSLICGLLVWIAFSLSGLRPLILGGKTRQPGRLYGPATPVALTEFLKANPPPGQIYNPQAWGDWLVYRGPRGARIFVGSNMHLIPTRVWQDYLRIFDARPGWQSVFDRYRVETIVADKQEQPALVAVLRRSSDWSIVYEDDQGLILHRRNASGDSKSGDA